MLNKLKNISNRKFVRNVATVVTGTAFAQAITMAFAPVITRLYGPEAFGVQGVFMSLAGILATIAALTYPIAIVLPKSDTEARGIAKLSILIGIVMSLIATLVMWLCGDRLLELMNAQAIADFIYLLPLFMFFSVLSSILNQWLTRKQEFKLTARMSVWQAIILNGTKAAAGFVTPSASILIITSTFGNLLQAGLFLLGIKEKILKNGMKKTSAAGMYYLAKRHRDFPLLRAPQVFLNTLSQSFPVLMLASFSGPSAAAFYSIAIMVMGVPSTLIGNAVAQVFYPRFNSAVQNAEHADKLLIKSTLGMAALGLPFFITIMLIGPYAFGFVFGDEWRNAGEYAQWLSIWLFFAFINRPSISAMPVLKVQGVLLTIEVVGIVMRASAIVFGFIVAKNEIVAIALFSISGILLNICIIAFAITAAKKTTRVEPENKPT